MVQHPYFGHLIDRQMLLYQVVSIPETLDITQVLYTQLALQLLWNGHLKIQQGEMLQQGLARRET
jgi:hypothetical protein